MNALKIKPTVYWLNAPLCIRHRPFRVSLLLGALGLSIKNPKVSRPVEETLPFQHFQQPRPTPSFQQAMTSMILSPFHSALLPRILKYTSNNHKWCTNTILWMWLPQHFNQWWSSLLPLRGGFSQLLLHSWFAEQL